MNKNNLCSHALVGAAALILSLTSGSAVTIAISASPSGPVNVNDVVTISSSISDWSAADGEVDAVAFNVDFLTTIFQFEAASGSAVSDGTEFLAKNNQGAGYNLLDNSSDANAAAGRYTFNVEDSGDFIGGSLGPSGPVGSFQVRAIATGIGTFTPLAGNGGDNFVFSDIDLEGIALTNPITFTGAMVEVIPEPSAIALLAMGLLSVGCRRRRP